MSEIFLFQVEESAPIGPASIQIEGRCCGGNIQQGDRFTELVVRTKDDDGSFSVNEVRAVSISVLEIASIRQGMLGLGEAGTLKVEGTEVVELGRDWLLKGQRSR